MRKLFGILLFGALTLNAAPIAIPDILDAKALKPSVSPCDNFYDFACGTWLDQTEIPADKNMVNHQNTGLADRTDIQLHELLVKLSKGDAKLQTSASNHLVDYFSSCMDYGSASDTGLSLLKTEIAKIEQVKEKKELAALVAHLHEIGVGALWGFGSGQDLNDSNQVIGFLDQGSLGLPEPSYYVDLDKKSVETREKYIAHIAQMLALAGQDKAKANVIFALEKDLASRAYAFDDRQNPAKINHPMTREALIKMVPSIDWTTYFKSVGAPDTKLNMNEPEYFTHLNEVLQKSSLDDIKSYLTWHLVLKSAHHVNPALDQAYFDFWRGYLRGQKKMQERWKQCTNDVASALGYALAEVYVKTVDTVSILAKINPMIKWIEDTFKQDLDTLPWLDASTKKEALHKLSLLKQKVGSPQTWRDYQNLKTARSSLLANNFAVLTFESRRDTAKIGKPVDRSEWEMMPWVVNAYYNPPQNEFVFPFGILQPPSFDVKASDGANLGAFGGGTIGHELTHGYDNDGSQYDANGNVKNWWSESTRKQYKAKSECFIKQANNYLIKDVGLNVDGEKTLSENLADQGGVKLGYAALEFAQSKRPPAKLWLNKYNERQQYWIAYAHSWCTKKKPEVLRVQIKGDPHPPEEFRVNGVVMNRPEFAKDFACKAGAPMAPLKRCEIW